MKHFKENACKANVANLLLKTAMVVALMCCVTMTFAKDKEKKKKNDFKSRLTLVDGTVIDGYLRTSLWDGATSVGISEAPKGKITKYKAEDVKELVVDGDEGPWTGLRRQRMPSIWNKNPGVSKKKELGMKVFTGRNVKGYVFPITTRTPGLTMRVRGYAFKYYYVLNGEDIAYYFWYDSGDFTVGAKAALKLYFKKYPKMVEMIDNGEIDISAFMENPTMILSILDDMIDEKK